VLPKNQQLTFGYCTNVHAGKDLPTALANLETYAARVRDLTVGLGQLPVGLWLSESAADSLLVSDRARELRDWLAERRLLPYTFNGFPQGDFHQSVVKHAVYEPTWTCQSRAGYTKSLAQIMEAILPEGSLGSISTLPLGWPHAPWHAENYSIAADQLLDVARYLDRLTQQRGCEIVVAIEPEPGCVLDSADDMVEFFERYLLRGADAELARRHLTVCHDICHSGVMFEPQQQALDQYLKAGLRIGKVQVSSAVHVPWDAAAGQADLQQAMLSQVRSFNEPKYLHQTTRCNSAGKLQGIVEDLPLALKQWSSSGQPTMPWRIHFHVPIFVSTFGHLATTQSDIAVACQFLEAHQTQQIAGRNWFTGHYEVETYAWPVLPKELAVSDLAQGIAQELEYLDSLLSQTTVTSL
jgi:sugar phosphate isomerase/epimerase